MARDVANSFARRSNRTVLMLALLLGALSAILALVYMNGKGESGAGGPTLPAVVAKGDIPARARITVEMLEIRKLPKDLVSPQAFSDPAKLVNQVTLYPIARGEQVLSGKVTAPGNLAVPGREAAPTLPLSYTIPQGQRAMAVSVSEVSGAGGLVLPGDRVDIIGTFSVKVFGADGKDPLKSEELDKYLTFTVLQNVQVLAVAQDVADVAGEKSSAAQPAPPSGKPDPKAKTVTVAVTPEHALTLTKAQELGSLRLALRGVDDDKTLPLPTLTDVEFFPRDFPLPFGVRR